MTEPRWLNESEARTWRAYRRMRALLDLQLGRDLAGASGFSEADYDVLSNVSEAAGAETAIVGARRPHAVVHEPPFSPGHPDGAARPRRASRR